MNFTQDLLVLVVSLKPMGLLMHLVVVGIRVIGTSSVVSLHPDQVRHLISNHGLLRDCLSFALFKA